jgi:hypothetical protein
MEGLESVEHLSGNSGTVGAKSKMVFQMGKRKIEMVETIIKKELPSQFTATYEAQGVWNYIENHFEAVDSNTTKYKTINEFKFKGIMKLVGFLMPGMFKKQSYKYLEDFKKFVESSI